MDYTLTLNQVVKAVGWIISNWQTIGAYSIGGASIATLAHKVERKRGFQDLQKLGLIIVALASAAAVLMNYAISAHVQNWHVLPKNIAYLSTASLFLHKLLVAPAFEKTVLKLTKFNGAVKQLENLEASQQAKMPVPPAPAPPTSNLFVS